MRTSDKQCADTYLVVQHRQALRRSILGCYKQCVHSCLSLRHRQDKRIDPYLGVHHRQAMRGSMLGFAPQHMQYQKSPSSMRTPQQMSWKLFKCVLLTYYALLVCLEPKRVIIGKLLICCHRTRWVKMN